MITPNFALNAEQAEYWNGEAAQRWTREQERLDRSLAPFGEALLARAAAQPGEHALDVGCGCGTTTLALGEAVTPAGAALGVDVSRPMLERARERARGLSHVRFTLADAAAHRVDRPVDLVASRFGVMFFRDPVIAFANLREALRPEGRLVFACWRAPVDNPWMLLPVRAAAALLPPTPAPAPEDPGPFAFADRARVERILEASGFRDVSVEPRDAAMVLAGGDGGLEEAVHFATTLGPSARLLMDVDDDLRARLVDAIRGALAPHVTAAGLSLPGAIWLVTARR